LRRKPDAAAAVVAVVAGFDVEVANDARNDRDGTNAYTARKVVSQKIIYRMRKKGRLSFSSRKKKEIVSPFFYSCSLLTSEDFTRSDDDTSVNNMNAMLTTMRIARYIYIYMFFPPYSRILESFFFF
jgi:hypothetical protein